MSKQTAYEFVTSYYDVEKGMETCERKSFVRFRKVMPVGMGDDAIEYAYTAFTGKSPRYNKAVVHVASWQVEAYKNNASLIIDALTHDPTSFTDLYNRAGLNPFGYSSTPRHGYASIRRCFKAMAAAGIIGCIEVHTCGKCHIRLYYLND